MTGDPRWQVEVAGADDEPLLPVQVLARRKGNKAGATISGRLTRAELRLPIEPPPIDRPRTRGDCEDGARPCPWVSCAYHLYLEVTDAGSIRLPHPDREPWELEETCALDVADNGGETLERVGQLLNITRERVRQVEVKACEHMRRRADNDTR